MKKISSSSVKYLGLAMASSSLWIANALVFCGSRSRSPHIGPVRSHSSSGSAASSAGRDEFAPSRRGLLLSAFVVPLLPLGQARLALAEEQAPEKFRLYVDKLEGYSFEYPASWIQSSAGGFRSPNAGDEFVSVELSGNAYYDSISELGTPEQAAGKVIDQYINEVSSGARGGVERRPVVLSASSRTVEGGEVLYEVELNLKSYLKRRRNYEGTLRDFTLEWDRRLLSVLGVGNGRLYEMRVQVPEKLMPQDEKYIRQMINSFRIL